VVVVTDPDWLGQGRYYLAGAAGGYGEATEEVGSITTHDIPNRSHSPAAFPATAPNRSHSAATAQPAQPNH